MVKERYLTIDITLKLSGPVAQLVEQLTFNQWVTGSNPVGLTIDFPFYYLVQSPTFSSALGKYQLLNSVSCVTRKSISPLLTIPRFK